VFSFCTVSAAFPCSLPRGEEDVEKEEEEEEEEEDTEKDKKDAKEYKGALKKL